MNSWLNWMGIARRAGALAPGNNQVEKALKSGHVALLILSTDAGPSLYRKYHLWTQDLGVPILRAGTKEELGRSIGMGPHAVLAILDSNIAQRLLASGDLSGGIQRGRKGQSSGLRVGEGAQTRQSTTHRPTTSAQGRKHQESYEHGGTGSGSDGAKHHGGKTTAGAKEHARAQTSRGASSRGPKSADRSTNGKPSRPQAVSKSSANDPRTDKPATNAAPADAKNVGRPSRTDTVSHVARQRPSGIPGKPRPNHQPRHPAPGTPTVSKPAEHSGISARVPRPSAPKRPKPSRPSAVPQSSERGTATVSRKPRTQRSPAVPRKPRAQRGRSGRLSKPTSKR